MLDVESKLEAVTIYREGALCTRRVRVPSLPPGEPARLRLTGLPLSLAPGSLRARLDAPTGADARVLDVRAGLDVALAGPGDPPEVLEHLEAARTALEALELELGLIDQEATELAALGPSFLEPARGALPREAPLVALLELEAFVDAQLAARLERRRRLHAELDDARAELELRRRRVAEAGSSLDPERVRLRRCAIVSLTAPAGAPVEVCLEYQVPGARWAPSYQLRLDASLAQGELRMFAAVAQATGEDWLGVRLALSTASLLRRTDTPRLHALRIGRAQPTPPPAGWRAPPAGLDELFSAYDEALAAHLAPHGGPGGAGPDAAPTPPSTGGGGSSADEQAAPLPAEPPPQEESAAPASSRARRFDADDEKEGALAAPSEVPLPRPTGEGLLGSAAPIAVAKPAASRAAKERTRSDEGGLPRRKGQAPRDDDSFVGGAPRGGEDPLEYALPPGAATAGLFPEPAAPRQAPLDTAGLPSDELLDYAELELAGVDDAGARGRLRRPGPSALALASARVSATLSVTVSVDVLAAAAASATEEAAQRARSVEWLPLPSGHAAAAPLDSFDYRFDCEHPVDVPSTGAFGTLRVMACEVGLTSELVCVPAVDPHVYRTIRVHNRSPHALLPGPVDVSSGERFLLTTSLPAIAPGSNELRVGLGVEEGVKVARNTRYAETAGGFLGGSTVLQHTVLVDLDNRLGAPATIEVRERVPVPAPDERDVKVEETSVAPAWDAVSGPLDGEVVPGLRCWRVTVPPNGRTSLEAQYVVRIPADKVLAGGNRRV